MPTLCPPQKPTATEYLAQFAVVPPPPPPLTAEQKLLAACDAARAFFLAHGATPNDLLCRKLAKLSEKSQLRRLQIVARMAANALRSPNYVNDNENDQINRGSLIGTFEDLLGINHETLRGMTDEELDEFIRRNVG